MPNASDHSSTPIAGEPGVRVLIVDDDEDAARMLGTMLESRGYIVQRARDAADALAELPTFQPDVAIVDIGLPGVDGYTLAREIRAASPCRLIALSGYTRDTAPPDNAVTPFDQHLLKPIDLIVLCNTIERLITPPAR